MDRQTEEVREGGNVREREGGTEREEKLKEAVKKRLKYETMNEEGKRVTERSRRGR